LEKVTITIEGDFEMGVFSMFVLKIERKGESLPIFLSAEQTNWALEYEDPFAPIMGLSNILLKSGFSIHQKIEIINGDDSEEQMKFLKDNNDVDYCWNEEMQQIEMNFSNSETPDNSNIELASLQDGYTFTIFTESNDKTPSEMVNTLKFILSQE
jgi:hypothetical protein